MPQARRARVTIFYENKDITNDLAPYLKSFEYTDNAEDKSDEIQITLEDREMLWMGDWYPTKGAKISAEIIVTENDAEQRLPCGTFEIDEIESNGSPNDVKIKAVSVPFSSGIRHDKQNKPWENIALSKIAQDIAEKASLELFFDSNDDSEFDRVDQVNQGDLAFLQSLCQRTGHSLKVTGEKIVIYDQEKYEQESAVLTLKKGRDNIKSYSFSSKNLSVYKAATVEYNDAKKGKTHKGKFKPVKSVEGPELVINERVSSDAEAQKVAKKRLRQKNKDENTSKIGLSIGDIRLVGGVNVMIEGFKMHDGKYSITQAKHIVANSGYGTDIESRKCLEGY